MKNTRFRTLIPILILMMILDLPMGTNAQSNALTTNLTRDTTVTVGRLSNGLTYYIKPNAKPAKRVELRLVLKAGSILEQNDQQGMAHFMEHMEFNGLKHYPKNELVDYLQKIGVQFGADLNANTGWDRTYYILPIPTDNPDNLEKGFQILGDWAGSALITTTEVNAERKVILEELRMRDKNAQTRMLKAFFPAMLNGSRYADRLSGGKDSTVQNGDPARIREFYHDWYRPDLMAIIVVGDITVTKAKSLIAKYLGGLKNPLKEKVRNIYHVLPYSTKKALIVTDSEATSYGFTLMFPAHPTHIQKTIGDFREELVKDIFTQTINRRLRDLAQVSNPPFANAELSLSGTFGAITLGEEGLELDVTPINDLKTAIDSAIRELLSIKANGFTDADIQISKNAYLPAYENAYKERNNTPSTVYTDIFAAGFMKGEPLVDIVDAYKYVQELLPTITVKEMNAFAKQVLEIPENYFTMVTGPLEGKIILPTEQGLLKLIEDAFSQEPRFAREQKSQEAVSTLLTEQPTSGNILSQTKDDALKSTTFLLSNGVRVTVLPTNYKKDEVLFSGVKYGGTGQYGVADRSNVTFLNSVISTMGYGIFSPMKLSDYLMGSQVKLETEMSESLDEVNGACAAKDLEVLLELNFLKLTSPRKDTSLLNGWKSKVGARLPLLNADPMNAFQDSLTKVMYGNNPLTPMVIPTEQDMNRIQVDRILDIYRDEFGNASGFHFFIVGNVNIDSLKPMIEKYIASLPIINPGAEPHFKDNGLRMVNGDQMFKFYKGSDQKSILLDIYHGEVSFSPELALKADMLAQIMTIKLDEILREQKQWIYSGNISANMERVPYGHYNITAQMPCSPENADKIWLELNREVAGYKKEGVSLSDLEKVKKAVLERHMENLKENSYWMHVLQELLFWKANKEDFLSFEKRVNEVTPATLKETANQLLGKDHFKAAVFPAH